MISYKTGQVGLKHGIQTIKRISLKKNPTIFIHLLAYSVVLKVPDQIYVWELFFQIDKP